MQLLAHIYTYFDKETNDSDTFIARYRVEMTISDATYSAVYVVFDAEMSKLTNVRAAEAGEFMKGTTILEVIYAFCYCIACNCSDGEKAATDQITEGDDNLSNHPGVWDATAATEQPSSGGSNAEEQLVPAGVNSLKSTYLHQVL